MGKWLMGKYKGEEMKLFKAICTKYEPHGPPPLHDTFKLDTDANVCVPGSTFDKVFIPHHDFDPIDWEDSCQ